MKPVNLEYFLDAGLKRKLDGPPVSHTPDDYAVELGPGNNPIPGCHGFGLPEWNADENQLPLRANSVDFIHAYHFFEHVTSVPKVLMECQRVLRHEGVLSIGVPYGSSPLALQDVTHKQFFVLDSWKTLFDNHYYEPMNGLYFGWNLEVRINVVMAVSDANPMLFTQFVKV